MVAAMGNEAEAYRKLRTLDGRKPVAIEISGPFYKMLFARPEDREPAYWLPMSPAGPHLPVYVRIDE